MQKILKFAACPILALVAPTIVWAQSNLILPKSLDDIDALSKGLNSAPCVKCGIVTNVRSEERQPTATSRPNQPSASGIGTNIATTPIIGSGSVVKDARQAMKPTTYYKISVRYDDGTYAFFEQDDEPNFKKGDKVETYEGRLELRQD